MNVLPAASELDVTVLVVTHDRLRLLRRTLDSLKPYGSLDLPVELIVVENGDEPGARRVAGRLRESLPTRYFHLPRAGKSAALNFALDRTSARLVCFHDDDIRAEPSALVSYVSAARRHGPGHFFGGPLGVDYEATPPDWLRAFLPPSAAGWSLGHREEFHDAPDFLGANWAAFHEDLDRAGGFATHLGPTESYRALGEETELQKRLLELGCRGVYVPGAKVWHWVPAERCTLRWARRRRYQASLTRTLQGEPPGRDVPKVAGAPRWLWRVCAEDALALLWERIRMRSERRRVDREMKLARSLGTLMGHRHRPGLPEEEGGETAG